MRRERFLVWCASQAPDRAPRVFDSAAAVVSHLEAHKGSSHTIVAGFELTYEEIRLRASPVPIGEVVVTTIEKLR